MTVDIKLPPLPASEEVTRQLENAFPWVEVHILMVDYARAAIKADRQQRGGEPGNGCECNQGQSCQVCDPVLEPVKVPSDEDIRRIAREMYLSGDLIWMGFDRDEHGEYTQPTITSMDITLFRALLARYGHPVEPEGWQAAPKFGEEK